MTVITSGTKTVRRYRPLRKLLTWLAASIRVAGCHRIDSSTKA
jgi:hypothetical protein